MIISEEQVQLALAYLHETDEAGVVSTGRPGDGVNPELVARIKAVIEEIPETRADRVAEARELLAGSGCTSRAVADKMIGRLISDSLR